MLLNLALSENFDNVAAGLSDLGGKSARYCLERQRSMHTSSTLHIQYARTVSRRPWIAIFVLRTFLTPSDSSLVCIASAKEFQSYSPCFDLTS